MHRPEIPCYRAGARDQNIIARLCFWQDFFGHGPQAPPGAIANHGAAQFFCCGQAIARHFGSGPAGELKNKGRAGRAGTFRGLEEFSPLSQAGKME